MTVVPRQPPRAPLLPRTSSPAPFIPEERRIQPGRLARWVWLPIPLLIIALAVVYALGLHSLHESVTLLTAGNTLFMVSASLVIAYLAARSYLVTGSRSLLSFGAGVLVFGIAYLVAGPLVSDPNESITLHNVAVFVTGALFILSALWAMAPNPPHTQAGKGRRNGVVSAYLGALIFIGLDIWASVAGLLPDFYVKGQGLTVVRQVVLGLGVIELLLAAGLFGLLYRRLRSHFLLCCSSGLAMIGIALGGALLTAAVSGSTIAWLERSGQWVGGAFLLAAIFSVEPRGGGWVLPLERALREGEERLQIALESAQLGTFDFNPDTRVLVWDEQTKRMCGIPLTTQPDYAQAMEIIHPDDREKVKEALASAFDPEGARTYEVEHRLVWPDGSVRWIHARGRVYFEGDGDRRRAVHLTGVNNDITERKQAEDALRKSEEEFRSLVDSSLDMVWVTDTEGGISFVNRTFRDFFSISQEEVLGDGWQSLIHPEDRPAYVGAFLRAFRERVPFRAEARVRRADGEWRRVDSHGGPRFSASGEYLGHLGISPDITESKRLEESLKLTQFSVDHAADYVYWLDFEGRFLYVNDSACSRLGYSQEELLQMSVWDITVGMLPSERSARWELIKARGSISLERQHRAKSGEIFPVEITSNYFEYGDREYECSFARDISDRKRGEQILREREDELRQSQKMEAIGQLAGGIAHDFNNLLTAILGYSELLLTRKELAASSAYEDVREIKAAADRASALTRQILAFSRRQALRPTVVSLNDVLAGVEPLLRRTLGEDIDVVTLQHPGLDQVEADVHQFEQVLINLALNARDAMVSGGRLTLETANVELDEKYCLTHPETTPGRYVMLAVSDTGAGMDEVTRAHIFEPFFTTKAVGAGTGLGLAMVYGIVRQSNGSIVVHSEPGKGTGFKIYLPRAAAQVEKKILMAAGRLSVQGTETILLVEDEATLRKLVARALSNLGYRVLTAGSGVEALRVVKEAEGRLDLLLADVVLSGGMQGNELAHTLLSSTPDLPVLYVSGYARETIVHSGRLDPAVNFLEKPFTIESLASMVRTVLDQARAGAS